MLFGDLMKNVLEAALLFFFCLPADYQQPAAERKKWTKKQTQFQFWLESTFPLSGHGALLKEVEPEGQDENPGKWGEKENDKEAEEWWVRGGEKWGCGDD